MFAEVEYAARQGVIDPANSKLLAALQANSQGLKSACARLVENMSVATPNQVFIYLSFIITLFNNTVAILCPFYTSSNNLMFGHAGVGTASTIGGIPKEPDRSCDGW